jgi:hypothetical protein
MALFIINYDKLLYYNHGLGDDSVKFYKTYVKIYRVVEVPYLVSISVAILLFSAVSSADSGNWSIVERSGTIIIVIGAVLATRRYLRMGVKELFVSEHTIDGGKYPKSPEETEAEKELYADIRAAKFGFCLSVIGTIINGWGSYMQWASFALFALLGVMLLNDYISDKLYSKNTI